MADRVEQNADLEDVLSSIRRLVSQNSNSEDAPALVLTEAERVSDEDVLQPAPQPAAPHPMAHGGASPRIDPIPPQKAPDTAAPTTAFDELAFETAEAAAVDAVLSQVDETPSELDASGMPDPAAYTPPPSDTGAETGTGTAPALDMDNLRTIVTDIVREELRGPLGQKITRNVRKLVRQEIQRAINAKSLD